MKNVNDKEINNVIYEGYKILDNREVTANEAIKYLNSLSISKKIIIMNNLQDILSKLEENNVIFIEALLKDAIK